MTLQETEQEFENILEKTKSYNIGIIINYIKMKGGLTREQTFSLFKGYLNEREKGVKLENSVYRTILILAYDRFVRYILSKMNIYDEDNYSVGRYGLIKAIDTFNIDKEIQFMSYAGHCIRNEVLMHIRKENLNINVKTVSIDDAVNYNDQHYSLYEIIKSDEDVAGEVADEDELNEIKKLFRYLPPIEQYCVIAHFGIYGKPLRQNDVADKTGLSQSYISRKFNGAISKLKLLTSQNLTEQEQEKYNSLKQKNYPILTKNDYENFSFQRQENKIHNLISKRIDENLTNQNYKVQLLVAKVRCAKTHSTKPEIDKSQVKTQVLNEKIEMENKKETNSKIEPFNLKKYLDERPNDTNECYKHMLRFLRPLEQICIIYRFGLYGKQLWTYTEIARKIKWNKELLQPIYKGALKKMKLLIKPFDEMTDDEKKKFKDLTKQNFDVIRKDNYLNFGKDGRNCFGC